jgi:group II intron reverse transcriptase/maturase
MSRIHQLGKSGGAKPWVIDADIVGAFDHIDHDFLLRAIGQVPGRELIRQWLKAGYMEGGVVHDTPAGTPQGGVISPVLSNLFLHYAFDLWMARTHPDLPWCRYADDGLVHCRTEKEAEALRAELQARLAVCGLQMHPTKTQIVYCKDNRRRRTYPNVKFDFLGYGFRPRWVKNSRSNELFCGFTPAVSATALKAMRTTIRDLKLRSRTDVSLADIARKINPLLRGWIEYYGRFAPSALRPILRYVNQTLRAWAMRKFKRYAGHTTRTSRFLEKLSKANPRLFVHWQKGMIGTFA